MYTIQLEVQSDRYLLSIDKSSIDRDYLGRLGRLIRVEYLAAQVDFDESVEQLEEAIQSDWWQANKVRLLADK